MRLFLALLLVTTACSSRAALVPPVLDIAGSPAGCSPDRGPIRWFVPDAAVRTRLTAWCGSVGPPVVVTPSNRLQAAPDPDTLLVVSWNVGGGRGDVAALLERLKASLDLSPSRVGLVLLLQEVVRGGRAVPPLPADLSNVPSALPAVDERQVESLAQRLGMWAFYVPSMRNGREDVAPLRQDRGNAILSNLPLTDLTAIELPFGRQRRVAVAATVLHRGGRLPVRLVSFHLDTRGGRVAQAGALAGYLARDRARGLPVLAGGDVNSLFGTRDAAYRALAAALPVADCGRARTNSWPWRLHTWLGWWRGRLDYIFATPGSGLSLACRTLGDYGGSDHLPVVLRADLARPYKAGRGNVPRASSYPAATRSSSLSPKARPIS